jgi:salicylate hydroxylase
MKTTHVEIIGGGIAGLTAALAFAKQGASVCVLERAHALTEVGAGLQITPNAGRALVALGVWDALVARGVVARAVVPIDGISGRVVTRFDLSGQSPNYLFLHRASLIEVLAEAAMKAGVVVKLGQVPDLDDLPPHDLLIGAEGLRSELRGRLNAQSDPFFTGQVAWRAIVPHEAAAEAQIWMMPRQHVVTYPLSGGRLNIVAVQERSEWAAEGWSHAAFAGATPELRAILEKVVQVNLWGLFRHHVADNWVGEKTAILGDAAHPTLPFLAQGANLAIEDAYVLARSCAAVDVKSGLQVYENARKSRVKRAIEAANVNARNYHLSGVQRHVAFAGLKVLGAVAPNAFLNRLSWLYDHDVTA